MLWPIVLPFQITLGAMAVCVIVVTLVAIVIKWKPLMVMSIAAMLAIVCFIPACVTVMNMLDARRFGVFQYAAYSQVQDFRIERYLPPAATAITLEKRPEGHRARYKMDAGQLKSWLDDQWQQFGQYSAHQRSEMSGEGEQVDAQELEDRFGTLGWPLPAQATKYYSISQADGGGARYYVDQQTGWIYQDAGYW